MLDEEGEGVPKPLNRVEVRVLTREKSAASRREQEMRELPGLAPGDISLDESHTAAAGLRFSRTRAQNTFDRAKPEIWADRSRPPAPAAQAGSTSIAVAGWGNSSIIPT
jgi:hypothetical protein